MNFRTMLMMTSRNGWLRATDDASGGGDPPAPIAAPADPVPDAPVADGDTPPATLLGDDGKIVTPPADPAADPAKADEAAKDSEVKDPAADTPAIDAEKLTIPEGFKALDTDALKVALPILEKMGVKTQEQAQEVINAFSAEVLPGMLAKARDAELATMRENIANDHKTWADNALKDPVLGNGNEAQFTKSLQIAVTARDRFGDQELRDVLNMTGLGNHPAIIRAFYKAGMAIAEDTIHVSDPGVAKPKLSTEEKLYGAEFQPKA